MTRKFDFANLDRRIIYAIVFLVVSIPIITEYALPPAKMKSASSMYSIIENLEVGEGDLALLAFDFGPNSKAENEPQAEVIVEHLMRKRMPVAVFSQYALAEAFLATVPERVAEKLMKEYPGQKWEYGKDWVNLGYRPGGGLFIQGLAKASNIAEYFGVDSYGTKLSQIPITKNLKTIHQIKFLAEFTGLVGVFDTYVQFFQTKDYVPVFGHGCTSITIPEAYIYLDSGQLSGLLEGIAGAAWYSELLKENNPNRSKDSALVINTALGVAHLAIIALIIIGNLASLFANREKSLRGIS